VWLSLASHVELSRTLAVNVSYRRQRSPLLRVSFLKHFVIFKEV